MAFGQMASCFSKAAKKGKQTESGTVGLWKRGSLRDLMPDGKHAYWAQDGYLREVCRVGALLIPSGRGRAFKSHKMMELRIKWNIT